MIPSEVLTREELERLSTPSDFRGWLAVATTWAMIAGSFAAVAAYPSLWTVTGALVILGGRHLALAILMHDAAHHSLFKTRALNEIVGRWLCAYPTWQDLGRYRAHHLRHHRFAGSPEDPDLGLIEHFPITRVSLARKFARDLIGLTGLKRVYGLLLMEFGYAEYTASTPLVRSAVQLTWAQRLRLGLRNLHGLVLTNLALFGLLWALGHPGLYALWILSWMTTFSFIIRIRAIAEHACTQMDLDPLRSTRTTWANPLARMTVAPHRVNFHLEHHLLAHVPHFQLPRLHQLLRERGALQGAYVSPGYASVLKTASSQR